MTTLPDITLNQDRYTCLKSIPSGAQAIVYKVKRHSDEAILALKVARVWNKDNPDTLLEQSPIRYNCKRIEQEIDFLSQLNESASHHIVSIMDQGTVEIAEHQCPAFVMPWYQHTLTKALSTKPVPDISQRLEWVQQMITALEYIHQQNDTNGNGETLVHRDFKPDNLMLDDDNSIRLLDFGISKSIMRTTGSSATRINYSPDCVAPEQVLLAVPNRDGKKRTIIGPYNDVYALGLVIYYLITNKQYPQKQTLFVDDLEKLEAEHRHKLHSDGKGLLGKVGGMNDGDRALLKQAFITLSRTQPATTNETEAISPTSTGTILDYDETILDYEDEETASGLPSSTESQKTNPALEQLAGEFTRFVSEMTHPEYSFRPSAHAARYWIDSMQLRMEQLQEEDKEKTSSKPLTPTPIPNRKESKKVGADSPSFSKDIEKNEVPHTNPFLLNNTAPQTPSLNTEPKKTSSPSPSGKEGWGRKALTTPSIKTLSIAAAAFAAIGLAMALLLNTGSPEPEVDTKIPTALFDTSEDIRQQAWQDLFNRSQNSEQARQQLDSYEQQINSWANSNNKEGWKKAIPGLKLASESGDDNAALWLAYAYQEGRGVEVDWDKAWQQYQQLAEKNNSAPAIKKRQELEKNANAILQAETSSPQQRKLAYQVIEARGMKIASGDNSHLWLAYRYRQGDGIEVDQGRAEYWQKRHDGLPEGTVIKRSQP